MFRLWLWLKDRQNRLWVTPALAGLFAVLLAFSANWVNVSKVAERLPAIKAEMINDLLSVIASSMLAVAIFSLGTLVSALSTSSTTATPRATQLLMGDASAHASIGSFIASFIFAIVAKIALAVGYYDDGGRLVLFVSTLAVLAYVVVRLLLWVRSVSTLGRLSDTVSRIERVTRQALEKYAHHPLFGALPSTPISDAWQTIRAPRSGYLRNIDLDGLQSIAEQLEGRIHVGVRPGAFMDPSSALARVDAAACTAEQRKTIEDCFVLGQTRSYEQDPRFGLIGEVAQRAMSPSVNDPGTAIEVLSRMTSLIVDLAKRQAECDDAQQVQFDRISMPAMDERTLVTDGFVPIARDGASMLEIGIRLQKMLAIISENCSDDISSEARAQATSAYRRGLQTLAFIDDRERLSTVHERLFKLS